VNFFKYLNSVKFKIIGSFVRQRNAISVRSCVDTFTIADKWNNIIIRIILIPFPVLSKRHYCVDLLSSNWSAFDKLTLLVKFLANFLDYNQRKGSFYDFFSNKCLNMTIPLIFAMEENNRYSLLMFRREPRVKPPGNDVIPGGDITKDDHN
jgi:hypothetical protein